MVKTGLVPVLMLPIFGIIYVFIWRLAVLKHLILQYYYKSDSLDGWMIITQ